MAVLQVAAKSLHTKKLHSKLYSFIRLKLDFIENRQKVAF